METRYYDPHLGRFLNPDTIDYLGDGGELNNYNLFAYCGNNPVMYSDPTGHSSFPNWAKWLIGGAIILGLGIATIVTGGAGAGVAGYVLAGAFKGAVIGGVSMSILGGVWSGIRSSKAGEGFWAGFANGSADGFLWGSIVGGIAGASIASFKVYKASRAWASTYKKTAFEQMIDHYARHVIEEGQKKVAKNIVKYTNDAQRFFVDNALSAYNLRDGVVKISGAPGGIFNTDGLIRSFWYILKP